MRIQTKVKLKRYLIYILILLAAHLLQNTFAIFPAIVSVKPVLIISAAVCISMFEGELIGGAAGLFAGALWDTVTASADGYNALFLMIACALCGTLLRIYMRNNIVTYIIMNTGITLFYFLTYILFFVTAQGIDGAWVLFLRYYLPMTVYSLVLTPLWYILIRTVNRKFAYGYTEY